MAVSDHVDFPTFMEGVKRRNPGQTEFVQAVQEVAQDIFDFISDKEEYHEAQIADLPQHDQLRIPTGEFPQRVDEVSPDDEVVLYCRSGGRSAWATAILMQRGYGRVLNLKGGVLGWRADVDPTLRAY